MMSMLGAMLVLVGLVAPALAQEEASQQPLEVLLLGDLANRPDRWPEDVTLTRSMEFAGGRSVKKGQTVRVLTFNGRDLLVDAGGGLVFQVKADSCDLLAAANEAWNALTPAQRAVDPQALLTDDSLWPARAISFGGFQLGDGQVIEAGGEFELLSIRREGVELFSREHRTTLMTELAETDIIARARKRALLEPNKRPSRIAAALRGKMVDSDGEVIASEAIDTASVYVLYFSASWCQPCRKFTPRFVEYVKEVGPANPKLSVVLMSNDKDVGSMRKYMQDDDMPWPAVSLAKLKETPLLLNFVGKGIPQLVVLDRHGKVLANSYMNGQYLGPDRTLASLKELVDSGVAR